MDLPNILHRKSGHPKPVFSTSSKQETPISSARGTKLFPERVPHYHERTTIMPTVPKSSDEPHLRENQQLDESLYLGYENKSDWKARIKMIQSRPSGWLNRFSEEIDESIIAEPKLTLSQLRSQKIKDSGWTNITIDKVVLPVAKPVLTVETMLNFNPTTEACMNYDAKVSASGVKRPQTTSGRLQSSPVKSLLLEDRPEVGSPVASARCSTAHRRIDSAIVSTHKKMLSRYCYSCLQLVPIGPGHVNCLKCPVVVHLDCIQNKEKFLKRPVVEPLTINVNNAKKTPTAGKLTPTRSVSFSAAANNKSTKSGFTVPTQRRNSVATDKIKTAAAVVAEVNKKEEKTIIVPVKHRHLKGISTISEVVITDELTSYGLEWICPFCHNDVDFYNTYNHNRHNNQLVLMVQLSNCIKIQSYLRMLPQRIRYNTLKLGITMLQRLFRVRMFNLQEEIEKANMRYPFRIRIHDIKMFVRINHSQQIAALQKEEKTPATMGSSYNLANFAGTFVNGFNIPFGINPNRDYEKEVEKLFASTHKPNFLGEITSMGYDKLFYPPHGHNVTNVVKTPTSANEDVVLTVEKATEKSAFGKPQHKTHVHKLTKHSHQEFFGSSTSSLFADGSNLTASTTQSSQQNTEELQRILMHNHVENPTYARTYKSIASFDRDTLFLTVSVHEWPTINPKDASVAAQHKGTVQLMRIDAPLKMVSNPQTIKLATLNKMGYKNISNSLLTFIAANYKVCTFNIAKPYILVPYCKANAEVKLTLSEVTDWPKAHMIGQLTHNIKHYILRKRSFVANQGMKNNFTFMDIPQQEEGAKLNVIIKPDFSSMTKETTSRFAAPTLSTTVSTAAPAPNVNARKDARMDFSEGAFTWSVLCMGYSEHNDFGYVEVLYQESIQSTRKKCWCVLIDRVFMIFNIVKENVKPRYNIDLRQAMVSVGSDEVIKIKSATDTQFFHFLSMRDYEKWMRKLYVQSASNHSVPYHTYIKKRTIEHSSYSPATEKPATNFNGLNNHSTDISESGQAAVSAFTQNAMMAFHRQNSRSSFSGSFQIPTLGKLHHRTSMERIDLLELEVSMFLDKMKHDYIQVKARDLITKHEADKSREYDKTHENNNREKMIVLTHSLLTHKQDFEF